jgi:LCP family protein required for cell wall assembly
MSERSRRRSRVTTAAGLFAATTLVAGGALTLHTSRQLDAVTRVDELAGALSTPAGPQNFLLVGSDTREGADPSDPDYGGIAGDEAPTGQRADTIMLLRVDGGGASLLSLPRDLYVPIAGTDRRNRINAAFAKSELTLVRTVQESLGIPVHHYLEVDFQGFKELVDAVGGVEICFAHPARDENTGLDVRSPGCRVLDGVASLQYARSRHYEELVDGEWRVDGTADLGRIARQQGFLTTALRTVLTRAGSDPRVSGEVVDSVVAALRADPDLDLADAARRLAPVVNDVATYQLSVRGETIGGASVLTLRDESAPVLDYFRGVGPRPPVGS